MVIQKIRWKFEGHMIEYSKNIEKFIKELEPIDDTQNILINQMAEYDRS